jgi:CheY-like chemotaxis protein
MRPHRHVLIVDDDPAVRLVNQALAREAGLVPVAASDGTEAVELVAEGLRPDLVVTDLEMPGLDGVGLLGELERMRASTLSIMFSSGTRPARNGGADLWLSKGNPTALRIALREFAAAP